MMDESEKQKEVDRILKNITSSDNSDSSSINSTEDKAIIIYKNGKTVYVLDEGKVKSYTSEIVEKMMKEARDKDDFGMNNLMLKQLLEIKKIWWPATQKNLTGSVKDFNDTLKMWIDERKKALGELAPENKLVEFEVTK